MKRRSFFTLLSAALCAAGLGFLLPKKEKPLRFFWVDDESEIFIAREPEDIDNYVRDERWGDELLTAKNKGEVWDEVEPTGLVHDEDGEILTFQQAFEKWEIGKQEWFQNSHCAQIATGYG